MRFFSLASVDGAVQTARRFPASATSCDADMGIGCGATVRYLAILASISPTRAPARFELRRHQPVLRISRVVLSECPVGGIARRLEVTQKGILNLVALAGHITVRLDGGGNGAWFDHAEQCLFDRVIDPQATESNAAWLAIVEQTAPAGIARNVNCFRCTGLSASDHTSYNGKGRQAERRHASALRDDGWSAHCR